MSTIPMLIEHERPAGRLHRFKPLLRGAEAELRKMTVASDVHAWLHDDAAPVMAKHRAAVRAHLGAFVKGEKIDDLDYMKRVEDRRASPSTFGHGVWSIRPSFLPQHRLFGFFVITDWFVVLSFQGRDYLEQSSSNWHAEIDKCWSEWRSLFPGRSPWIEDDLWRYVSRQVEKRDDRW